MIRGGGGVRLIRGISTRGISARGILTHGILARGFLAHDGQESQTGVKWRISPPICARIPRGNILCAETLEMPLKSKKVIYSQHVDF